MRKQDFLAIFICNLATYIIGAGAIPLLPVYARDLGAPPSVTGYYLALAYAGIAVGSMIAGWLSDTFDQRRNLLLLGSIIGIPATWGMGQVRSVWALAVLTTLVWFIGGVGIAVTNVLAGRLAPADRRGKVFGLLMVTNYLGTLIGGAITGPLVDRWGYAAMFTALAAHFGAWLLCAPFIRDQGREAEPRNNGSQGPEPTRPLGQGFYVLFSAQLVASIAAFVNTLGRSLSMDALGFSASAISSTGVIGGAIAVPLPFIMGSLSDRMGRKRFLFISYLGWTVSLLLLAFASSLWHFWLAIAVGSFAGGVGGPAGNALITDIVDEAALGRGLSMWVLTVWIGAVIGFATTGQAVEQFGVTPTLVGAAVLPLIGAGLLALLPARRPAAA